MGNVHFSGQNRNVPSYAMNSPKENVFENSNVRFHIDGKYLNDFSDKGIERFIEKNVNNKSGFLGGIGLGWGGKDLEFKEVKAFIQAAAANAENIEGMTFDLSDPQLGLFDDDDVKVEDIRHSFTMNYKPTEGTSSPEVSFVDATSVRYDSREARQAESRGQRLFKTEQTKRGGLETKLEDAVKKRDKIASRIGGRAGEKLAETQERLSGVGTQLSELKTDMSAARSRLTQTHIPDTEKRELRLMIRGMELEQKDLEKEQKSLRSDLTEKHGFWSFVGGGSTLEDLRKANQAVEQAQQALTQNKPDFDLAKSHWEDARNQRREVEAGASLSDLQGAKRPGATPPPSAEAELPPGTGDGPGDVPPEVDTPAAPTGAKMAPIEAQLQQILALPATQQAAELAKVPVAEQGAFLNLADNYLRAGEAENPFNLPAADFKEYSGARDQIAATRLNALLAFGDSAQDEYLSRVDQRAKSEILGHLSQNRFDQQLEAQAAAFKTKLEASLAGQPPAAPESVNPPANNPVEPVPAANDGTVTIPTPDTPVTEEAPRAVDLRTFQGLEVADKIRHFPALNRIDQDLAFTSLSLAEKGLLLQSTANQSNGDTQTLERLTQLMQASDKQALVNEIAQVLKETEGVPHPMTTANNLLLNTFAQQGVAPQATTAPGPVVNPAVNPTPGSPVKPEPQAQVPPAVVNDEHPTVRIDEPQTQSKPTPVAPTPVTPQAPKAANPKAVAQEMMNMGFLDRARFFVALDTDAKVAVFAELPQQVQVESLISLAFPVEHKADRQAVLASLSAATKQSLAAEYNLALPAAKEDPQMEAAIKTLISELGGRVQPPVAQPLASKPAQQQGPTTAKPAAASVVTPQAAPKPASQASAQQIAQQMLNSTDPDAALQSFTELKPVLMADVFKLMPDEVKPMLLLQLTQTANKTDELAALVKSFPAEQKSTFLAQFQAALQNPEVTSDPEAVAAIQKVVTQLRSAGGSQAATVKPSTTAPVAPVQPGPDAPSVVAQTAPQPESGKINMGPQLQQLKQVVSNTSYFSGVTDKTTMNQLIAQIWDRGTQSNREEMAKTLVNQGQSQALALMMVGNQVSPDDTVSLMSASGFDSKRFMKDIDDDRAFLLLSNLGQRATKNDAQGKKAQDLILQTVSAYDTYWDREEPFKRMKTDLQGLTDGNQSFWNQLPKTVRDKIDALLGWA